VIVARPTTHAVAIPTTVTFPVNARSTTAQLMVAAAAASWVAVKALDAS
jgi:hypothetical protein